MNYSNLDISLITFFGVFVIGGISFLSYKILRYEEMLQVLKSIDRLRTKESEYEYSLIERDLYFLMESKSFVTKEQQSMFNKIIALYYSYLAKNLAK